MLRGLLKQHTDEIVGRWFDDGLSQYSADAHAALRREGNRFANPLGHSLRECTRALFDALLDGAGEPAIRECLDEIVRIRAVQQMSPSQALGFVFHLKALIRDTLGDAVEDPRVRSALRALEERIDAAALTAFDLYLDCRERVAELRIEEVKRNTPWFVGRMNRTAAERGLP